MAGYIDEAIEAWSHSMTDLPPLPKSELRVEFEFIWPNWYASMVPGPALGGKLTGVGQTSVEAFINLRVVLLDQIRRYQIRQREAAAEA